MGRLTAILGQGPWTFAEEPFHPPLSATRQCLTSILKPSTYIQPSLYRKRYCRLCISTLISSRFTCLGHVLNLRIFTWRTIFGVIILTFA
ncbi:Uncharacterized protein HZ326_3096 [Fusarium oxysporum f. sp. albedinis]|nr:Uncharacterized protein HZ326_3096 [Fusarium oxysporum f. sp. albedinis]